MIGIGSRRIGTPEATAVADLIESSGLDLGHADTVKLDDRIGLLMHQIIFSPEGKAAAAAAATAGLPALAGVDRLLKDKLGRDYGSHNEATVQAGYLVANLMRQLGYESRGVAVMPEGCIAKSGTTFALPQKPAKQ